MQQLLLIPLLAPLLAALLVGALNPRPAVALRLLVWTTPALPLGSWIAAAAAAGAGLSAGAGVLALRQQGQSRRSRTGSTPAPERQASASAKGPGTGSATATDAATAPASRANRSGPSRAPGEPAPTVEVPFRVIRRGSAPAAATEPQPVARAVGDGWGEPLADSWD